MTAGPRLTKGKIMAKINITGGNIRLWSLCSECKRDDSAFSVTEIVENAKRHLATEHADSTRTHRIEMDMDHLVTLVDAARLAGAADGAA
jgi:hypothetical protein